MHLGHIHLAYDSDCECVGPTSIDGVTIQMGLRATTNMLKLSGLRLASMAISKVLWCCATIQPRRVTSRSLGEGIRVNEI
jgi:hypothetical protein